ncbi:hypothetical protein FHS47_003422 [Lutibacter sp. SG786]|nr:hypothetical protein [Luteibacter sp. SG786]
MGLCQFRGNDEHAERCIPDLAVDGVHVNLPPRCPLVSDRCAGARTRGPSPVRRLPRRTMCPVIDDPWHRIRRTQPAILRTGAHSPRRKRPRRTGASCRHCV